MLFNVNDLLDTIKRASIEAIEVGQPCDFCFGRVISVLPLRVSIDQKLNLGTAQLILTRNVTDFMIDVTDGDKKKITVHNALKAGESVILLKQKGGQKYLILDRLVNI